MTAPTREQREEWRKLPEILLAEADISDRPGSWSRLISASTTARGLLLALDAAEEEIEVLSDVAEANTAAYEHASERLAAVRALAEDWIPSGDDTAATCGWAITAVLDDQELAAITVKSLGRRCGLDGCADPTCGGNS